MQAVGAGERLEDTQAELAGRVVRLRVAGRSLVFADITAGGGTVQMVASAQRYDGEEKGFDADVSNGPAIIALLAISLLMSWQSPMVTVC